MTEDAITKVAKMLQWLKQGYPQGIPPNDFPPVLNVLHRNLTDDEIVAIADQLALQSVSQGVEEVTADQIRDMVKQQAFQHCTDDELRRVSVVLAQGGWPLADDVR